MTNGIESGPVKDWFDWVGLEHGIYDIRFTIYEWVGSQQFLSEIMT